MQAIKVYRNVNSVDKLFGLELADGCILLLGFFAAFMLNREGLVTNVLFLGALYLALRALKRGKPDAYMLVLARYVLTSRFKRLPDADEVEEAQ